ncbi:MAG: FAD-dependent oxidoreductase [Oligoflexia bacterium]|nr:FAD-dependent oxidoreductase [Oligoflexia bacterium]
MSEQKSKLLSNSDRMYPLDIVTLLQMTLSEYEKKKSIFGIPASAFFSPKKYPQIKLNRFNQTLDSPLGVAAGPQTQLSQNIICSWLVGCRFIELKTIQTLDELEVSKPCIDMEDEGFNCEWSQELKLHQSYNEYLNAWIMIHILKDKFKFANIGTIFNMSVGYNLEGIMNENVQTFLKKMRNAGPDIIEAKLKLKPFYPRVMDLDIPSVISDNITLSTMHGCPPDEIEKIGLYLIGKERFHTTIKLNPTLNGAKELRDILNNKLGYININVPDIAFEHDLKYKDALAIIKNLKKESDKYKLHFSIKFTNTLEVVNNKYIFDKSNQMMYMSGRGLHALSINIANKIQKQFAGKLDITLSGGIDAFNVGSVLATNIKPLTVCSDLLKPGGYSRLAQYLETIKKSMDKCNATNLDELVLKTAKLKGKNIPAATLKNLKNYSEGLFNTKIIKQPEQPSRYHKEAFPWKNIKTSRTLTAFDCIKAPCQETCPAHQMVPLYMYLTSKGEWQKALEVIRLSNPFANSTGMACDHTCETKCTRINYDSPLKIREIKRYLAMKEKTIELKIKPKKTKESDKSVAIIGGGPSGLSAAYYLRLAGLQVQIFEKKENLGGMITNILPNFRTIAKRVQHDIDRIKSLGVVINENSEVKTVDEFEAIQKKFDYTYVAVGASRSKKLNLEGENECLEHPHESGLIDFLSFLELVKTNQIKKLPPKVVVIGGGNSAIDAARSAKRLVGTKGSVTLVYRRTVREMPADKDEIHELKEEKINIIELTLPHKIISNSSGRTKKKVIALECVKMALSDEKDKSGRPIPKPLANSNFKIKCDYIINAIGQEVSLGFLPSNVNIEKVLMGGDAARGPSSIIKGVADGLNAALTIASKEGRGGFYQNLQELVNFYSNVEEKIDFDKLRIKKANRHYGIPLPKIATNKRKGFDVVIKTLTDKEAKIESARCLHCDKLCDVCVSVCPNRANISYEVKNSPRKFLLKDIRLQNGEITYGESFVWSIEQRFQTANISNFCNECGNCATFCPTSGKPYMDKPKICLTGEAYDQLHDNAFYFTNENDVVTLKAKFKNVEYGLIDNPQSKTLNIIVCNNYNNSGAKIEINIDRKDLTIQNVSLLDGDKTANLAISAKDLYKMIILFESLKDTLY